ncbi:MAG: hypothetical protein HXM54_05955 [Megasphaera micronuciformis]|nr:hypothetical protein [Megasphaera micronuciformis]
MDIINMLTEEHEELLGMLRESKHFTSTVIDFPCKGCVSLDLISWNNRNRYLLDINRKSEIKTRYTLQNRLRDSYILLRLDLDNKPHKNPDNTKISGNHLHIFDKNDGSGSWAFELNSPQLNRVFPQFNFSEITKNGTTPVEQFRLFCSLCNVDSMPNINEPLDL